MAEIITNSNAILKWMEEKQANEQAMLYRLNNMFKGSIPTNKMRRLVLAAIQLMAQEASQPQTAGPAVFAVTAEKKLAVWSRVQPPSPFPDIKLMRMANLLIAGKQAAPPLDVNDFSELIRVIGAWLEKGGGYGAININKAYRAGVAKTSSPKEPTMKYLAYLGSLRKKYGWQYADRLNSEERANLAKYATSGDYLKKQGALADRIWAKDVRQREDPDQHHSIEEYVADFWVRPKLGKSSGMQMFRANRNDLCKKMDLLFGLIVGATISGTTTDTVLVLEAFGSEMKPPLHSGYYLFPVGTIAASLHHSLLEAGLAMTIADVIDSYCVGFYSTLIPKGGLPGELEDARGILKEAEEDPKNRHMLIWYNGNEKVPTGCIRWNKPYEIRDARRLMEGKGLLSHVQSMPKVPDKMAILRLIKVMAPKLFAYLPEELQLR